MYTPQTLIFVDFVKKQGRFIENQSKRDRKFEKNWTNDENTN
jgi:hypothetical protein